MSRWNGSVAVVACVASFFMAGCAVRHREIVMEQPMPQPVQVQTAPPPEHVEVVPVAPSVGHVWIRGHWHWNGIQWVWRPGRYEARRVGYRWVPAHYEQRGGVWLYIDGHYAR